MDLKRFFPLVLFAILIVVSLIYAANIEKKSSDEVSNEILEQNSNKETKLSEIQIKACNSAELGGTCFTKLPRLNIVDVKDCCRYLGKCC